MFSHVWQPLTSGFSDLKCVHMLPWHQQNCIRACMYIYYAHYVCTHTYVYLCISMCKLRLYDRVINNILMMVKKKYWFWALLYRGTATLMSVQSQWLLQVRAYVHRFSRVATVPSWHLSSESCVFGGWLFILSHTTFISWYILFYIFLITITW